MTATSLPPHMPDSAKQQAHLRACAPGAARLETIAGYSVAAGVFGEIGGVIWTAGLAATGRPLAPGLWALGVAAGLLAFGFVGVKAAYVWARRTGFAWDYDRDAPKPPPQL